MEELTCPECGYKTPFYTCMRCGAQIKPAYKPDDRSEQELTAESLPNIKDERLSFKPDSEVNPFSFAGRAILFLIIAIWSIKFITMPMESNYAMNCWLYGVDLIFHEAGHVIFRPFGRFIMMFGGSLNQLLIPLICLTAFLIHTRDLFAASVSLWWLGENLMDLAPYINDARSLKLMLLGGITGREAKGYHDWEFLLHRLGWLQYDHTLATITHILGISLMLCALAWGGFMLFKQLKILIKSNHKIDC